MKTIFAVSQTESGWRVDQHLKEVIKTSRHSSKTRALTSIANRLTGIKEFAIIIPDKEGK